MFMWLATFAVVTLQKWLPLNPDAIANMEPTLAFNTISSFTTNTNLQHYSGETGLSYLSQMIAITFLQFVTAATGVAACIAIIGALGGNRLTELGNFYVDLTRASVRMFLPLACLVGTLLVWQGVPTTFGGAVKVLTLEGGEQTIARGVVAPQWRSSSSGRTAAATSVRIPPTPTSTPRRSQNFVETWSITIVPMAMVWTLGYLLGRRRLVVMVFVTMLAVYLPMVAFGVAQEAPGNPRVAAMGVGQSTGSMEGKEVRFGAGLSALWCSRSTPAPTTT
jgi:K+-transporting ATPase ATPase A chain